MALTPGTRLGAFQLTQLIGRGGMGEVYRARDTKLDRDVAIKILPEAFAHDTDRLARFTREAKTLASLNHPNIAIIHGLEHSGEVHALVMELVEGDDLSQRIARGAMPLDEALPIAKQIAEALEAAHEQGIIHRDLKPANVKVRSDGTVKVLDFGLAKAMEPSGALAAGHSQSPTITTPAMTQAGMILGTAAYMSPEQARGKTVDKRADIWAFGAVLYEMLTGRRLFMGDDTSETLAAVIKEEPNLEVVPERVRHLLRMCLQKDPRKRLRDIADATLLLDHAAPVRSEAAAAGVHVRRLKMAWGVAALAGVAALVAVPFSVAHFRETAPIAEAVRFQVAMPDKVALGGGAFSVSPDGRKLIFAAVAADGTRRLYVRALDSLDARPLQGTEGAGPYPPFWSPDSRFVGFSIGNRYMKIDVAGGPPQTLSELPGTLGASAWGPNGVILVGSNPGGLMQVPEAGGIPSPVTAVDPSRQELYHGRPAFLPDGRHFLYVRSSNNPEFGGTYIGSLDAKPQDQDLRRLLPGRFGVAYVPSSDPGTGYVLFERESTVMAQTFDNRTLELTGQPVPIAEQVGNNGAISAFFSTSENGVLATRSGGQGGNQLTWLDRSGTVTGRVGDPGNNSDLELSPDGTRAAIFRVGQQNDIWLYEFARGTTTRFTFSPSTDRFPVWSPDGNRIVFGSNRGGRYDVYQKSANGTGEDELLFKSDQDKIPSSWSTDGRFLIFQSTDPKTTADIWVLPMEGDRKPLPWLRTEFTEGQAALSPDGRWIAYTSLESGRAEIYVRPFLPPGSDGGASAGGKWQVSRSGGTSARWRGDSKELFYVENQRLMAVDISANPSFQAGIPQPLFNVVLPSQATGATLQVTADGKRFLTATLPQQATGESPVTVVLNWPALLTR
jgi:Tol biopolymer transport system component